MWLSVGSGRTLPALTITSFHHWGHEGHSLLPLQWKLHPGDQAEVDQILHQGLLVLQAVDDSAAAGELQVLVVRRGHLLQLRQRPGLPDLGAESVRGRLDAAARWGPDDLHLPCPPDEWSGCQGSCGWHWAAGWPGSWRGTGRGPGRRTPEEDHRGPGREPAGSPRQSTGLHAELQSRKSTW